MAVVLVDRPADFALARYDSSGALDTAFGTNGIVISAIGTGEDVATSLIVGPDGTIVVAGYSNNGSNKDYVLGNNNATFSVNALTPPDLALHQGDYPGVRTVTQNQPFTVYVLVYNAGQTAALNVSWGILA